MKKIKLLLLALFTITTITSCFEDNDDNLVLNENTDAIKDFVWKGMNAFYVYGNSVTDLSNDRFGINGIANRYDSTDEYLAYLSGFDTPESLFNSLVLEPGVIDRFSSIVPDLFEFIDRLNGTSETTGLSLNLYAVPNSTTEVFAVIRLVQNNSVADNAGLTRGLIIRAVNDTNLNRDNFSTLLNQSSLTLNFADYNDNGTETTTDDTIDLNNQSQALTAETFTANPVHRTEVLNVGGETIGYLMYTSFRDNFETELNAAFAEFQAANVGHLVLDLRYNGGGAIVTAVRLASMITGQFNNDVFSNAIFGPNMQNANTTFNFTSTITGGAGINSLNLDKVYVLTTSSSASASELIINSLRPYIDVVQIGTTTTGKTTINRLVFDSPNYGTTEVNAQHTYAMFPLIGDSSNVNEILVPSTGLVPDIVLAESPNNFGTLGNENEPLLAAAIADITGANRSSVGPNSFQFIEIETPELQSSLDGVMYVRDSN